MRIALFLCVDCNHVTDLFKLDAVCTVIEFVSRDEDLTS